MNKYLMTNKYSKLLLFFLLLCVSGQPVNVTAKPLELVSAKMIDEVAADTLLNMSKFIALRSNPPLKFTQKPTSRTYYELENFAGVCSLAIIRSKSTEHKFNWLIPSFVTHFSIVKRKNDPISFIPTSSVVAVPSGSIMSKKIEKAGLIGKTRKSRQQIVDMMISTNIHFWGDADRVINSFETQTANLSFEVVKKLPPIEMWVACSKKTDNEVMESLKMQWHEAKKLSQFRILHNQLFQLFLR